MSWLVLRCQPQKEFDAEKRIKERGYDAICPYEEKWRRRNSRTQHKKPWKYPLFTRYVFAGIASWPHDWIDIRRNVDAIQGVIGFNGAPAVLSPNEVGYLASMTAAASVPEVHKAIKVGSPAIVSNGPFQGQTVTVNSIIGKKAHVLLRMFNSMPTIEIPLAKLEPV